MVLDDGHRMAALGTPVCNMSTKKETNEIKKMDLDVNTAYWVSKFVWALCKNFTGFCPIWAKQAKIERSLRLFPSVFLMAVSMTSCPLHLIAWLLRLDMVALSLESW